MSARLVVGCRSAWVRRASAGWLALWPPLLSVSTALAAVPSRAPDGSNITLIWDAPETCPSADVVRGAVLELLRAARPSRPVRIHAQVSRDADAYRVRLVTHREGERGMRDLDAPTCAALVDGVTIIIALAIDPELFRRGSDAASPGDGAGGDAEVEPSATPAEPPAAERGEARADPGEPPLDVDPPDDAPRELDEAALSGFGDRGLQVVAAAAGSVESGALPGLGFGITARGGVRRSRFRAELAVTRWLAREAFSPEPGKGATFTASAFAGWGCYRAIPGHTAPLPSLRAELPPDDQPAIEGGACIGVEVGQMTAKAFGVLDPHSGSSAFASLGGALRLGATAADWLSLDVRVEALSVLHRPAFQIQGLGEVHRPDTWSLRASMGAEVYFP